jgi:hypothetical protein
MPAATLESLQQDSLVMSVARALATANEEAAKQGANLAESLVTIAEERAPQGRVWRINYGPRDYVAKRGGDLSIFVEERTGAVQRVIRGQ